MKRLILFLLCISLPSAIFPQIIADHTVVDRYSDIPQQYLDEVKKMWLVIAGESHSYAYMSGLLALEGVSPAHAVSVRLESGTPEPYTTVNLRASRATWGDLNNSSGWIYSYGEEDWWTSATAVSRTKAGLLYCHQNGPKLSAIGFGWCWDPQAGNPSSTSDPVYGVRWYGWSVGSPEGPDRGWGLDNGDNSITGNSVNLDTYLNATQEYINYCQSNNIATKVFFTTGPVDRADIGTSDEGMYNAYLKYERIRNYVKTDQSRILFDYADILSYNASGSRSTLTWNGHTFPTIHPDNIGGTATGHIGSVGALRLAKAMWWMLARIAGWDGTTTDIVETFVSKDDVFKVENSPGELRIYIQENNIQDNLLLYSTNGTLVKTIPLTGNMYIINTSHLLPGAYIITLRSGKISHSKKIVVS